MTNPLKGEIDIDLGGETYKCRLTIDSLVKIEDELNLGILEIASNISEAKVRLRTLLTVLRYAMRGGGNDFDEKKVKQIITDSGLIQVSGVVAQLIADTLTDPDVKEESGAKKSQETTL